MSAAVNQFLGAARQVTLISEPPRILVNGQTALMKWCEACQAIYPHLVTLNGSECAVCGCITIRDVPARRRQSR
jgi:rRNA maturation endonuclease Nob1